MLHHCFMLSEFSNMASTSNSWFVTGKGSWGVELKLFLTASVLFCSCPCRFHVGDSSSISPVPWHSAVPLTPPPFSEAVCLQFLLCLFHLWSVQLVGLLGPKKDRTVEGETSYPKQCPVKWTVTLRTCMQHRALRKVWWCSHIPVRFSEFRLKMNVSQIRNLRAVNWCHLSIYLHFLSATTYVRWGEHFQHLILISALGSVSLSKMCHSECCPAPSSKMRAGKGCVSSRSGGAVIRRLLQCCLLGSPAGAASVCVHC